MRDHRGQAMVTPWWTVALPVVAITLYVAYEVFATDPSTYSEASKNVVTAPTGGVLELLAVGILIGLAYLTTSRLKRVESEEVSGDE